MHRFASGETDIERDTRLAIDAEVRSCAGLIANLPCERSLYPSADAHSEHAASICIHFVPLDPQYT